MTGSGDSVLVTVICARAVVPTTVVAMAVLLVETGSVTDELAVALSEITVPLAVPAFTLTTSEKFADVPPAMFKAVQTTLPERPTPGVMQVHPAGDASDMKVVLAGSDSTNVALSAALGPLLVMTWV